MTDKGSLRDRRRVQTVAEIKAAALGLLESGGPEALSLRGVAREVGVSVQALYHYFDGREALITALVTDAYLAVADAVREGGSQGRTREERLVGAGLGYRRWALDNRPAFLLALGAPLPDYAAPQDGPTTAAAHAMSEAFREVVFDGWSSEQIAAVPVSGTLAGAAATAPAATAPPAGSLAHHASGLSDGALQLFVAGWATVHGYVMLEAHGHLDWIDDAGDATCRAVLTGYAAIVERARSGA